MKTAFAVVLFAACLLMGCYAQNTSHFQSVGGDYGKSLIGSLKTNTTVQNEENNNAGNLWSWGSVPKGSLVVDNILISDPRYSAKTLKVANNWLGDSFVDPYGDTPAYTYTDPDTGQPVVTYVDPNTGQSYYTYIEPKTGKTVYVYFNPVTGAPTHVGFSPIAGMGAVTNDFSLPPIFSSNNAWSSSA